MTQPIDLAAEHARQYRRASEAQTRLARQYLAADVLDLSLAATACHRALQFERQAQALEQLARELNVAPAQPATGLHGALLELLDEDDRFPWVCVLAIRSLLEEYPEQAR